MVRTEKRIMWLILQAATFLKFQSLSEDTSYYCYLKTSVSVWFWKWQCEMLPNSVSLNVKWHFCLFSTSELNDDKWYLYLCISLGFCFGVALIFWKLWTTKHVRVILLWTMMLAAVMLLLWSFEKKYLNIYWMLLLQLVWKFGLNTCEYLWLHSLL